MIVTTKKGFKKRLKDFSKQQILALIILGAIDVFVIAAPYYVKNVVPNLHLYLGITEDEVATVTSIIGYVTLATQLPGGFLANRFSSRKLLFLSAITTGAITSWLAANILTKNQQSHDALFIQYCVIWGLWGITSTLIFWTPLWKLASQQATKENQALGFGIQGAANGIWGLIFIFLIALIITSIFYPSGGSENADSKPFAAYAFIIAIMLVITGFTVLFFVKEKPIKKQSQTTLVSFKRNLNQILVTLKNWKLWLLSFFLMGMYVFQSTFAYYLLQMLQNAFLAPVVLVTVIGGIRTYALRSAVSVYLGRLADKCKSYILFLMICTVLGIVFVLAFILLGFVQTNSANITLITFSSILYIFTGILSWGMVTVRYNQIGEIDIGKNNYASSIGLLSFIGFSTDGWLYTVTAEVGKKYTVAGQSNTSNTGYQIIAAICLSIALFGLICGSIVFISNSMEIKRLNKASYRWRDLDNA